MKVTICPTLDTCGLLPRHQENAVWLKSKLLPNGPPHTITTFEFTCKELTA
jgi:hypothetical protein